MATREQELAAIVACLERYPAGKGFTFFSDDEGEEDEMEWEQCDNAAWRLAEEPGAVEYG